MSEKFLSVLCPLERRYSPAVEQQVFDVSGANDTVIAVLALCAAHGIYVKAAIALANDATGIVVIKLSSVPIAKGELLSALQALIPLHNKKLVTTAQLLKKDNAWHNAGDPIFFTNGFFDLLYVDHNTLLEQCKQIGKRLIVVINSNHSVASFKSVFRSTINQKDRTRLLTALCDTDTVFIFNFTYPCKLIRQLKSEVLIKSQNYTEWTSVGADDVKSWSGQMKLIPLVDGTSTADIFRRLSIAAAGS